MPPLQFVVDRREAGKTLPAILKARYGLSWARAKRLVEGRHVKVSGQVETDVARRVKLGKPVEVAAGTVELSESVGRGEGVKGGRGEKNPDRRPPTVQKPGRVRPAFTPSPPHPLTPSLVYQDDAVVVADKPAGLTTMRHADEAAEFGERGRKFLPKTLADLLPGLLGSPNRPVIAVHRIDRDTSGLVVFARTRAAADHLAAQFRKHAVDRRYLALTRGVPPAGRIESLFVRDRGDGRRGTHRIGSAAGAKRAVTHVKVLEELGAFALVECRLETGRTHQVRIHLGEAGAPLCGEAVYDRPVNGKPAADGSGAARPMLHAARLGFAHPETGDAMGWDAPPPADFAGLLARLRAGASA
ncbi:MAG: RluA family pseudouridine synthase [Isosphaera sp.]|nr:RluA family pseudouridine synthase [Isosphaera sp.]